MNSFPGVNREPQEPTPTAPQATQEPTAPDPGPQTTPDSIEIGGAFLSQNIDIMFAPSGFVHRSDLEILFGGPISDPLYFAIVQSVINYTGTVLSPVIRPFILAIKEAYEAQEREQLTEEEDQGLGPRVIYVDEDTDINQVIREIFESDTED